MSDYRSFITGALDALKRFDRRGGARLIRQALAEGPAFGSDWQSVAQLAAHIGEVDAELEAARRYAATTPITADRVLFYANLLMRHGRESETEALLDTLSAMHPAVMHMHGVLAAQRGYVDDAEALFRQITSRYPPAPQAWAAITALRKFAVGDPDIGALEALRPMVTAGPAPLTAQYLYALGKVYDDIGETTRAAQAFAEGAGLMRGRDRFDHTGFARLASVLTSQFDAGTSLVPSRCDSDRVLFVTGLPRSGTTLVQQILTAHSRISGGAELGFTRAALIPARDGTRVGARAYEQAVASQDPWGDIGRDYLGMLSARFGNIGRIVDKTTMQGRHMGLLLHSLPNAKVIWMRRRPEDCALSCYQTFFTFPMPWSWAPEDIAAFFKVEDNLYCHWTALYPDRVLTIPYEDLVCDPKPCIDRILAHVDLAPEPQVYAPHEAGPAIQTASLAQARQPISNRRVGVAERYPEFVSAFRAAYG